jgi:CubicO group peptidase (beta-lactamase class C family)
MILLLTFLFCVSSIFCFQREAATESKVEIPQTLDELKAEVNGLLQKHEIPGVAIALVSRDSIIWMAGIGHANVKTGSPITENTHFRVGSITKTFIGLGFLKLVEQGRIDLNKPVREVVPEIEIINPWSGIHPVRIIHLLEHTAGFDDSHINSIYNKEDPEMPLKRALDAKAGLRRVRWQPGTRYAYSSPGYTLAGYILEKITGQRYEDYLKAVILDPIGMTTSTFRLTDESKHLLSVGYGSNFEPVPYFDGYDRPASSLNSSAEEMAKFVQFLLNRGKTGEEQIISGALIDQMGSATTTTAAKAGLKNGYSFGVGTHFQDGFKWYGHSGGGPGFIAKYSCLKDYGVGYVVLANKFSIPEFEEITDLVQRYLIREMMPPSEPSAQIPSSLPDKYCGYYELRSSRQELVRFIDILLGGTSISLENDTLYQKDFMSSKEALLPVSPDNFRKSGEPEASRVFTSTPEGNIVFATSYSYYEKTGRWKPFVYRGLLFGALTLMLSSIIYAIFWIPVHLLKRIKKKENRSKYIRIRLAPLLGVLCLIFGILVVMNQSVVQLSQMSFNNVFFFVSTLFFAGFSILSVVYSILSFKKAVKMVARVYSLVLSLSCLGMTIHLAYWKIIGLRLWAY